MLEMTATVAQIDSQHVKLTNVKKFAYYDFPDQRIQRGNWSSLITSENVVIGFNANVKTFALCDTDGETYKKVARIQLRPTSKAQVIRSFLN